MRPHKNERGQASIMIGMMMMTFILFFAFAINTGMLVNAKINLQNAADMAAYSGAATQARTLNQISFLNYEMRRQYKKFLFRYYVMGNMAQRPFPRGGGSGPAVWSPDGGQIIYGAPTVCMIFNSQDNFCQLAVLAKIEIPKSNPFDQINKTLISQLQQIEGIRQSNCLDIGKVNSTVLKLWLWNTDPGLDRLAASAGPAAKSRIDIIRGLAYGLGLIPRELILRQRIDTLAEYLNQPPAKGVTLDKASGFQNSTDPAANERTIQAFLSAYYTLGNHIYAGDIVMDELQNPVQIELKDIKAKFDTYAINFMLQKPDGSLTDTPLRPSDGNNNDANCKPIVEADTVKSPVPLGVYKSPAALTYYAVRLKASAKVMFSPFGDMELKAYAAAQPFGSRIGPRLEEKNFVRGDVSLGIDPAPGSSTVNFENKIPNLPIRETESVPATGTGWDTQEALSGFYQKFAPPGGNSLPPVLNLDSMERAYQAAMVPNPFEANRYNIINDFADSFVHNFDDRQVAAFWAPIMPPDKANQADTKLQGIVEDLFGDSAATADLKVGLKKELSNYLSSLREGKGERIGGAAEGFNIARIQDPFHTSQLNGAPPTLITVGNGLAETRPDRIKSSWNAVLNKTFRTEGRVGYSVKFVSFDSLTVHRSKSDDAADWTNRLATDDSEAQADIEAIKH